ncbi:helix-turn-helix domain-containing protein [Gordonia polyisoprenivorans]|uniref:helix-turn-helix transcriptional regulator n=1 Tax=Gordonia polyisoprenivorans TaxID=84595 RepID=UPI000B99E7B1|nr:helix-turn-helix domain-containing protein [Gordonia polyisoprenivorans]OZC29937.1 hypothetical protein CJJ17_25120 [Gordonia polyisoprenivorans]QUD81028.1 helix-turn-helix domain-containing protein [Gordonia polyisoprenivorans]
MTKRYVSLDDAADYAGVSTRTIRRWITDNRIAARRVGPRLVRVDLKSIDAMFEPMGAAAL